ncbi:hypothetical protein ALC57_13387 [Trachymyrmex cornetzi]|uniref:Uncharacterized protein n=1 Tax=Trachymyrmex cornetzi TaxID=471704 RepID=A0A195DMT8_9HYME|nr:hypothetical protein ALC57_13387 [Trachymyrmex cornetzi]
MSLRARSQFDASNLCYIKDKPIEYHSYIKNATISRRYLENKRSVFAVFRKAIPVVSHDVTIAHPQKNCIYPLARTTADFKRYSVYHRLQNLRCMLFIDY